VARIQHGDVCAIGQCYHHQNNALLHSDSHIESDAASNRIILILSFCLVDLLPRFCNGLKSGPFGSHKSGSLYWLYDLLDYCSFGVEAANDAQNVRVDTVRGKDHDQQNLFKDNVILQRT